MKIFAMTKQVLPNVANSFCRASSVIEQMHRLQLKENTYYN